MSANVQPFGRRSQNFEFTAQNVTLSCAQPLVLTFVRTSGHQTHEQSGNQTIRQDCTCTYSKQIAPDDSKWTVQNFPPARSRYIRIMLLILHR